MIYSDIFFILWQIIYLLQALIRYIFMKLGIIYIVTGAFADFWDEFYFSCELFFCFDAQKYYEVFTDSEKLLNRKIHNVHFHAIEDKGWIVNVSSKSLFICNIKHLLTAYDYVFYLNGNFKAVTPISYLEIIPTEENDWITILAFSHYREMSIDEYPYDRNIHCSAFIPYGTGKNYYQGGIYGGRTRELILLSEWCKNHIHNDLSKGVIARHHDESYLNKYLLNKNPRTIDETYAFSYWCNSQCKYKAVLLTKEEFIGQKIDKIKNKYIENSVSPIQKYMDYILATYEERTNIGLLGGKMGVAILLFHYSIYSGNLLYGRYSQKVINNIFDKVNNDTPLNFKDGLCGIAWGICYLAENNFFNENIEEILEEVDAEIMELNVDNMSDRSLEYGLLGISVYLNKRKKFSLSARLQCFTEKLNSFIPCDLKDKDIFDKIYREFQDIEL